MRGVSLVSENTRKKWYKSKSWDRLLQTHTGYLGVRFARLAIAVDGEGDG